MCWKMWMTMWIETHSQKAKKYDQTNLYLMERKSKKWESSSPTTQVQNNVWTLLRVCDFRKNKALRGPNALMPFRTSMLQWRETRRYWPTNKPYTKCSKFRQLMTASILSKCFLTYFMLWLIYSSWSSIFAYEPLVSQPWSFWTMSSFTVIDVVMSQQIKIQIKPF